MLLLFLISDHHSISIWQEYEMLKFGVEKVTSELLKLRSRFSAPYLTRVEREQLRADITNKLDWGNKYVVLHQRQQLLYWPMNLLFVYICSLYTT